jgi:hypothetical protein
MMRGKWVPGAEAPQSFFGEPNSCRLDAPRVEYYLSGGV